MESFYWTNGLMQAQGLVHVVYKNRGVRLRSFCRDAWWNISQVVVDVFPMATCLACLDHPAAWERLRREW